jgi:hypothetical protein
MEYGAGTATDRPHEKPEFIVDFAGAIDRGGDGLPEDLAVAQPEPVENDPQIYRAQIKAGAQFGKGNGVGLGPEVGQELPE